MATLTIFTYGSRHIIRKDTAVILHGYYKRTAPCGHGRRGVPVKRHKDGDCTCLASTIPTFSGTYTNGQSRSGTSSPTIIYDGDCYDTYGSIYLGQGDDYLKRDHCSGGQGFTGLWFELDPIRLYASGKDNKTGPKRPDYKRG